MMFAAELASAVRPDEYRGELPAELVAACEQAVTAALLQALNDPAQNDIGSSSFEDDENSLYYVAATAAESLVALGYAPDVAAVFATAAAAGRPVHECRNNP